VLIDGSSGIDAFALCHYEPQSEAGADTCFVKFGAVRTSRSAERKFERVIDACEALALAVGMPILLAGVNMGARFAQLPRRNPRCSDAPA
jgi:hypothetical protein